MNSHHRMLVVFCSVSALVLSTDAHAQNARVLIRVYQKGSLISTPSTGAAVCFTSTDNTKITDTRATAIFSNVPKGTWSAVAWKTGYKAKRVDIPVTVGSGDVNASIYLDAGAEASPCVLPVPPPVSTAPPAPGPGEVSLVVRITDAAGSPLQGARVCAGSGAGATTRYAGIHQTSSTGRVWLTVPKMYDVHVTASHDGHIGQGKNVLLPTGMSTVNATLALQSGSGGVACATQ